MNVDFTKGNGLVPAIIQDYRTLQVLMMGYMNAEAFAMTKKKKRVTFYSRSKGRLWTKGETSGNYLNVVEMCVDCDNDTILIQADPNGPTCHTGSASCFTLESAHGFVYRLQQTIENRIENKMEDSYTYSLFNQGMHKVAQKVGEEAVELVIEAMSDNDQLFKNEAADLLYHLLILLKARNMSFQDIEEVLQSRSG